MKLWLSALIVLLAACAVAGWQLRSAPAGRSVLVLEDFEQTGAASRWEGPLDIADDHPSHGRRSAAHAPRSRASFDWLRRAGAELDGVRPPALRSLHRPGRCINGDCAHL